MAGTIVKQGVGRSGAAYQATRSGGVTSWRIDGIENVLANINEELRKITQRSAIGLKVAAAEVLLSADTVTPKVPMEFGILRGSTFIEDHKTPMGYPYVELGYGTKYAAAVHEMMSSPSGKPIKWKREGSGPKFLEASLKRNSQKIVQIVAKYAEIK